MNKIFLIRHGATDHNQQRRYTGAADVSLSACGRAQADRVGKLLADENISRIFTSPLSRCADTAGKIAAHHDITPLSVEHLSEIDFGQWEGMTFDQVQDNFPIEINDWFDNPSEFTFPGGEAVHDFSSRVISAIDKIITAQGNTVIVAHGGTLRVVISYLCDLPIEKMHNFMIDNASVSILKKYEDSVVLKSLNDTCHLHTEGAN